MTSHPTDRPAGRPAADPAVDPAAGGPPGLPVEDHPDAQQDRAALVQRVVAEVTDRLAGSGDPQTVREQLADGLEAAGLPPQPPKWLGDTAAEIAAGRGVVVDRRLDT